MSPQNGKKQQPFYAYTRKKYKTESRIGSFITKYNVNMGLL